MKDIRLGKAMQFRKSQVASALVLAFGGLVTVAGTALAQDATSLERVEITGSAIKRINAETSVPVTVVKVEELKKQGINSVEQIMQALTVTQSSQGTSQVIGSGTGGASFADMRGIGQNKTLVLLNGRRVANNSIDGASPDLNMIPLAAIERIEVLRDGASALYGTDAIGGVINFITRNNFTGGTITVGADSPKESGGRSSNVNIGGGFGDLEKQGFNVYGFVDLQKQDSIGGTQRPFNTRYPGGISPTPFPANYFQGGASYNPDAPGCTAHPNNIPSDDGLGCQMTTSSFVDYIPKSERNSGFLKGTLKINNDHQAGLEYFYTKSKIEGQIAPVPYGGLRMNPFLVDANGNVTTTPNPYYPVNPALDPNWNNNGKPPAGTQPGYITVKWRDLYNGPRGDINENTQQRLAATLEGMVYGWDYKAGLTLNKNKVDVALKGYSDGVAITAGMLNGVLNPFGDQSAAGVALLDAAALNGPQQTAETTSKGIDAHASRELNDWFGAGRAVGVAVGFSSSKDDLFQVGSNYDLNVKRVSSTGFDPDTNNRGDRTVNAVYTEFNVPITKQLEVTAAARYDKYSDFGSTTNPKFGFRFQPNQQVLIRGSMSTGFRAPSLYDLNSSPAYTNTTIQDDPVNCPGGVVAPGKTAAISCGIQAQALTGGNKNLKPEESKNATLGIIFEPTKELSLGLDFWTIKLKNQISTLAYDTLFSDPTTFASYFHRNPDGYLSTDGSSCPGTDCGYVDARTQNLGDLNTNGFDLSAQYRMKAGSVGAFVFGLQSTYVTKYEYQDYVNGPWNQNVGVYVGTGPIFRWTNSVTVNWSNGNYSAGLAGHIKSGYVDADPAFEVGSYATYDAYVSWSPVKALSVTLGVRNLLDTVPPLSYQTETFQAGYDPRFTDPTGRAYYLRGTYNF